MLLIFFRFLCCPIICLYVLSSVLGCPLRFTHKNDVRFVFTPLVCRRDHVLFSQFVFAAHSGAKHGLWVTWLVFYKVPFTSTWVHPIFFWVRVAYHFSFFCVVLLCIFTFWFPCSDIRYDLIKKRNDIAFVCQLFVEDSYFIYVICACLRIVLSNTACVVFLLCFCTLFCQYFWIVHFWLFYVLYRDNFHKRQQRKISKICETYNVWCTFENTRNKSNIFC